MHLKRWSYFILFYLIAFLATDTSYAAGIIARIQQAKRAKQQHAQGMTPEQYQQYQAYQEQQQGDQAQNQPAPTPLTYQQLVDQRNQAIAQAIIDAHNKSITTGTLPVSNNLTSNQTGPESTTYAGAGQMPEVPNQPEAVTTQAVDLAEVWKKLDKKSAIWSALVDNQSKVLTVAEYIDRFHQEGVKINETPLHYVQMIDQITSENPGMLNRPFGELLQMVAIVDYDFDNGMNKDDLARKILGEAGYEANKQRFAQQQQQH